MTPAEAVDTLLDVVINVGGIDFEPKVREASDGFYLQLVFDIGGELQKSRKWLLSEHMTKSELVQTALLATLTALEHEAREGFAYKGEAVFAPHFNVDALVALSAAKREDKREEKQE
jgi:hypothetical protein